MLATVAANGALGRYGLQRRFAAAAIDRTSLTALGICSVALAGWSARVGGPLTFGTLIFALLMPVTCFWVGRALLRIARVGEELARSFSIVFLVGTFASALILMTSRLFLPIDVRIDGALLCAFAILAQRPTVSSASPDSGRWFDVVIVAVALAASTFWAQDILRPNTGNGEAEIFSAWSDYFIHANATAMFSSVGSVVGQGNFQASGRPIIVYHYASYALPALLSAAGGLSAYEAVVALWAPLATFLAALAAYALVTSWWGRGAGTCALIGVLLVPDASVYGARNPWFAYHWLTQISPSLLYGIASSAIALLFIVRGAGNGNWRTLALGVLAGVSTFLFKAQIFVVAMPLVLGWPLLFARGIRLSHKALAGGVTAVLSGLAIVAINRLHVGPTIRIDPSGALGFLQHSGRFLPDSAIRVLYTHWLAGGARLSSLAGLSLLALLGIFGALLCVSTLMAIYAFGARRLQAVDALPAMSVLVYMALALGLGITASYELQHRPFVWAYFLVAAWTWGKIYTLLCERSPVLSRLDPWVPGLLAVVLLSIPWREGAGVQAAGPPWAGPHTRVAVPRGLVDCAEFLRTKTRKDAVIQDSAGDEQVILGGLSERRSYLCRPREIAGNQDFPHKDEILARIGAFDRLRKASTREKLAQLSAETGVRWYVLHPGDHVDWPEDVQARPAFASHGYTVYRLHPAATESRSSVESTARGRESLVR
jgi:hypothetical protein